MLFERARLDELPQQREPVALGESGETETDNTIELEVSEGRRSLPRRGDKAIRRAGIRRNTYLVLEVDSINLASSESNGNHVAEVSADDIATKIDVDSGP